MIKKSIESELRESNSPREIRNYVKCQMKYFYMKGNSRPPAYSEKRSQLAKALYCELLSLNAKVGEVINCDEFSFEQSIKKQYSWLSIGQSWYIINDRLKGQASLILDLWNTGEWLTIIVMSTINSDKFWFFFETAINSNQQASWGCSKFSYYRYHPSSW